ncbi:MAG: hypothetical protein FWH10_09300 [Oscillospiraceae bacterium]|nr:hypothetical protein [Oscillospiraceae bacterium]
MTTEKPDAKYGEYNSRVNSKYNRDFERRGVYTPRNLDIQYGRGQRVKSGDETPPNNFRFKNSLIITPYYETEFNAMGGIKYLKNHDGRVFFTNDGIFATTNNIQKIPVLVKRSVNKQAVQKKLIIEEKYNYEEKYEIFKNIILYYEENRIDFQILFNRVNSNNNIKDITTEFSLSLSPPSIYSGDDIITYKRYNEKQEQTALISQLPQIISGGGIPEYIIAGCGKNDESCMTLYADKRLSANYDEQNKSLRFVTPNGLNQEKNYINLKIYLENYRVT